MEELHRFPQESMGNQVASGDLLGRYPLLQPEFRQAGCGLASAHKASSCLGLLKGTRFKREGSHIMRTQRIFVFEEK
jgi:hypothetical protein